MIIHMVASHSPVMLTISRIAIWVYKRDGPRGPAVAGLADMPQNMGDPGLIIGDPGGRISGQCMDGKPC